ETKIPKRSQFSAQLKTPPKAVATLAKPSRKEFSQRDRRVSECPEMSHSKIHICEKRARKATFLRGFPGKRGPVGQSRGRARDMRGTSVNAPLVSWEKK